MKNNSLHKSLFFLIIFFTFFNFSQNFASEGKFKQMTNKISNFAKSSAGKKTFGVAGAVGTAGIGGKKMYDDRIQRSKSLNNTNNVNTLDSNAISKSSIIEDKTLNKSGTTNELLASIQHDKEILHHNKQELPTPPKRNDIIKHDNDSTVSTNVNSGASVNSEIKTNSDTIEKQKEIVQVDEMNKLIAIQQNNNNQRSKTIQPSDRNSINNNFPQSNKDVKQNLKIEEIKQKSYTPPYKSPYNSMTQNNNSFRQPLHHPESQQQQRNVRFNLTQPVEIKNQNSNFKSRQTIPILSSNNQRNNIVSQKKKTYIRKNSAAIDLNEFNN